MTKRDWAVWSFAIAISTAAHSFLLVGYGRWMEGDSPVPAAERAVTRVSFRATQARRQPAPTPALPPQETPKPVVERTARPEPRPRPRPVPKPDPARHKAKEAVAEATPSNEAETPPAEVSSAAAHSATEQVVGGSVASVADPALLEKARNEYLARLMAHIEAHKRYPGAARRRGIEGKVKVAFTLSAGGDVVGLQTRGGRKILRQAAEDAVRGAMPLPTPPEQLNLPLDVVFSMVFALR